MKIIKQNDSAGGLVFKQNTAGKAMKQNYNFGRGYLFPNPGLNNKSTFYLSIPAMESVNLSEFSIIWIGKHIGGIDTSANNCRFECRQNTTVVHYLNNATSVITTTSTGTVNSNLPNINGRYITFAMTDFGYGAASNFRVRTSPITTGIQGIYNETRISTPAAYNKVEIYANQINTAGMPYLLNRLVIFNRKITSNEFEHIFNNYLSNELLNVEGVVAEFINDSAEIIGSDIGISDAQGGDMYLKINNLPAGTLEAQRDYANANLFASY